MAGRPMDACVTIGLNFADLEEEVVQKKHLVVTSYGQVLMEHYASERAQYSNLLSVHKPQRTGDPFFFLKKEMLQRPAVSSASLLQYTFDACICQ